MTAGKMTAGKFTAGRSGDDDEEDVEGHRQTSVDKMTT